MTTAHEPLALLVILTVSRARLDDFRAFERQAARIMHRYGGAIERTLVFPLDDPEQLKEVHVVSFPTARAFDEYRADPELARLAPLRERAVVSTEIWRGRNGPEYLAEPSSGATLAR